MCWEAIVKRLLVIALALCSAAPSASAFDFSRQDFGRQKEGRAFWLRNQGWSNPQPQAGDVKQTRFTTTYTAGVARRFGLGGGHLDFFDGRLGGASGPAIAGTVEGGAAKLVLRWHPDE